MYFVIFLYFSKLFYILVFTLVFQVCQTESIFSFIHRHLSQSLSINFADGFAQSIESQPSGETFRITLFAGK